MRIISGIFKARQIKSPHGHRTHPMSEKARGAIFNVLGDITDMQVLDAFAGTGALGFEALSRGARSAVFVERDKAAQKAIAETIKALGLEERTQLDVANVTSWSGQHIADQFDIVFCDPPYDHFNVAFVRKMTRHVRPGGTFVLSFPGDELEPFKFEGLELVSHKTYGDAQLAFYKRTG